MMMQNKFIKNLYQILSFAASTFVLIFALLAGFFASLGTKEKNSGWILLVFVFLLILLFFLIGFYWIFQTILIDKHGIQVKLFHKVLRDIHWESVENIKYGSVMRNPAYILTIKNEKNFNLDSRKKIKKAFAYYGDNRIKELTDHLLK